MQGATSFAQGATVGGSEKVKEKMAQGKKYPVEIREKAQALLSSGQSVSEVAAALGLSYSTVYGWNASFASSSPDFEELRKRKKAEFIENAWDCVMRSQNLIKRRLERAERNEELIDELIKTTEEDGELSASEKRTIINKLAQVKLDDVSKLGVIMGTMYDKYALAANEPTLNHGGVVRFEEL